MRRAAFTLVEVLIVVVILGILAAVVTPQFASATTDAKKGATIDQLRKVRNALAIYMVRNNSQPPEITAGVGTWGQLIEGTDDYLREPPRNMYIAGTFQDVIIIRDDPDTAFVASPDYGWIYSPTRREVWAANFNANDEPIQP